MEELLEIAKYLAIVIGGGGLGAILKNWWDKKAAARRDDLTYVHDGYRELIERNQRNVDQLSVLAENLKQQLEGAKLEHTNLLRENLELRAEITQLRLKTIADH